MLEKKLIERQKFIKTILLFVFVLYTLYIFLSNWLLFARSNFDANEFTGALRLITHFYIRQGLTPYNQFGVVYPPGLFLLIGKVIPFVSIFQRNFVFSVIELCFVILNNILIGKMAKNIWHKLLGISLFEVISVIIIGFVWNDPISYQIATTLILLNATYFLSHKKHIYIPLTCAVLMGISVFFRWDLITQYVGVMGVMYFAWIVLRKKKTQAESDALWILLIYELVGFAAGIVCLGGYLAHIHALTSGFEFIFRVPALIAFPYRKLPLPAFASILNNSFAIYSCLFILAVNCIRFIRSKSFQKGSVLTWFLFLVPFAFLPYALGRTNVGHVLPLVYIVGISLLLEYLVLWQSKTPLVLLCILLIPVSTFFIPRRIPKIQNYQAASLDSMMKDCKSKMPDGSSYKSVFVGRTSYHRYISNSAVLYLINPQKPPASAYISDEPGVQNSCTYGSVIANQLEKSPKPMVAFLETKLQNAEPNRTKDMKSCGKIETFLSSASFKTIGTCTVNAKQFEVRIYE